MAIRGVHAQQEAYAISKAVNAMARGIARSPEIKQKVIDGICQIVGQGDLSGRPFKDALIEAMNKGNGV